MFPSKSALLLIRPKSAANSPIQITLQGSPIPITPTLRILGLYLQDSGRNDHTLKTLKASTQSVLQLLRRVSSLHKV